jgi:hypothetical protein
MSRENRISERHQLRTDVGIWINSKGSEYAIIQGEAENISRGGVRVRAAGSVSVGTHVFVEMMLSKGAFAATGEVVRSDDDGYAIRFLQTDVPSISALVEHTSAE